jgi:CheY-like chemotaxis protein
MESEASHVLIVDDSDEDVSIVESQLKGEYLVSVANSGEGALNILASGPSPDVILMDVEMPALDGYETCRLLKNTPETSEIDVIFISAHDTTEQKLYGYEAGGNDYLTKPVDPAVLRQKVRLAIEDKTSRAVMETEKFEAMQTAMTAISSAGEQGVVVDFMRRSFTVENVEALARLIVEATANFGLESSVQLRTARGPVNAGSTEPMPPLEVELLTRVKDTGRLSERGSRLIANFGPVTQLIKNMPEDEDRRGRLRDHIALLLEGAEARLKSLEMQQRISMLVIESNKALHEIEIMQKQQKETAMQIMDGVMAQLEKSFLSYGLMEEQEEKLLEIVRGGVDKSLDNFEQGLMIDEKLREIVHLLERSCKV